MWSLQAEIFKTSLCLPQCCGSINSIVRRKISNVWWKVNMKPLENLAISQISSLQIKSLLYKCQLSQYTKVVCLVAQSYLTLCDPMDCSSPGSSAHGDSPDKNTGVGSMPSSKGSSQPRDWIQVFHIAGKFFTIRSTSEAQWWGAYILQIRKLSSRRFVTFPRQKAKI